MSEYTTIWEAVRFGTLKDVIEIFKKGDEKLEMHQEIVSYLMH